MDLNKLAKIVDSKRIVKDSTIFNVLLEYPGVTSEQILFELDQWLSQERITEFIKEYAPETWNFPDSQDTSLIDWAIDMGLHISEVVQAVGEFLKVDEAQNFISDFKESYDLESIKDESLREDLAVCHETKGESLARTWYPHDDIVDYYFREALGKAIDAFDKVYPNCIVTKTNENKFRIDIQTPSGNLSKINSVILRDEYDQENGLCVYPDLEFSDEEVLKAMYGEESLEFLNEY